MIGSATKSFSHFPISPAINVARPHIWSVVDVMSRRGKTFAIEVMVLVAILSSCGADMRS